MLLFICYNFRRTWLIVINLILKDICNLESPITSYLVFVFADGVLPIAKSFLLIDVLLSLRLYPQKTGGNLFFFIVANLWTLLPWFTPHLGWFRALKVWWALVFLRLVYCSASFVWLIPIRFTYEENRFLRL